MNQSASEQRSSARLDVVPVQGRGGLKDFLQVPYALYRDDPHWVAPLNFERREALAAKQPFFAHAQWQAWVAYHDGAPVGRITAQIDDLYEQRYGERAGYFGMLEAPDDQAVFTALFGAAESWLRGQAATQSIGPFNLGINQELGILVDGFDTPPYFMMPHSRPYYGAAVEAQGYQGVQDLLAYVMDPDFTEPPVMAALMERVGRRVNLRPLRRKHVDEDLEIMRDIFNDAWSENWGFVPFTQAEFNAVGREMLLLIPDDFICIAELDGEPAAFLVLLPNLNEAIADLRGRLLPLGWAKLLWRLKVRFPRTGRVPLMGVRRAHHHTRLGPGLAFLVIAAGRAAALRTGMREVEMSWILADNMGMRSIIENIGGTVSKRYRMYQKPLL
ncbi:MAG: N-acetyltransferase [Gammaproteobacteria bacterium]|nr:N-acetyltransferase [Gammaproteobacteria bacterium]